MTVFGFGNPWASRRAARRAFGALAEFYSDSEYSPTDADLLAVDVETTGVDPASDYLLSIGWVPVRIGKNMPSTPSFDPIETHAEIVLEGAGYVVVKQIAEELQSVGESATIHGITDDMLAAGVPLAEALTGFLRALKGKRLLAHYAQMELGFISAACERTFGAPFLLPETRIVDTMQREYKYLQRQCLLDQSLTIARDDVRLWNARARYGLPEVGAHHALTDALACAELWLAQEAYQR